MINNPILCGFHPDPSICTTGDDFYLATSTFEYFPGVRIFHSKDLKNWEFVCSPLNSVDKLNMLGNDDSGGIWAPALSYYEGTFYLLYTDIKVVNAPWKNARNFLITAQDIKGPWSSPIVMDNGGFDPFLYHEGNDKYFVYRVFGPGHHSDPHNRIYIEKYDHNLKRIVGDRLCIYKGTKFKYTEGPQIFKKNSFYYLITAEGGTSFEHRVTVSRSKNLLGPYENSPFNPLITSWDDPLNPIQKAGHASFVKTKYDEWYICYLMSRPLKTDRPLLAKGGRGACPLGRETSIAQVQWQDDWPVIVGGNHPQQQIPMPKGIEEHRFLDDINGSFKDNFDKDSLSYHWQTLRIPFEKIGSLKERKSHVRLYGKDSLVSTFEQGTIATRWRHFNFTATVKVDFNPKHFQQSAGIACFYNTNNFTYLNISRDLDSNKKILSIWCVEAGAFCSHHVEDQQIYLDENTSELYLRVEVENHIYSYSYSYDGINFKSLPHKFESKKISDDFITGRGFFTGAFVCLHCEDISSDGCFADFSDFSYKVLEQ